MRIKQEDFDKLKQLDRIEYRQKERKIKEWGDWDVGSSFLYPLILITVVSLLLFPQAFTAFGVEATLSIVYVCIITIKLFLILTVLGFILDIVLSIKRTKMLNEFREEYFNFKVEVKK